MSDHIVILTGAGLSAESGLGTFRDTDGIWSKYDLEEVATPQGFARNPDLVHEFYNARRANCCQATPNAAHVALAKLQEAANVTLITQNVDDLLERAGARDVIHMHGELTSALCPGCAHRWQAPLQMHRDSPCPACQRAGARPDIVWFGEYPYHMTRIARALATAELFVAIGTSGQVYPAAGFVQDAATCGARTMELNLEPSAMHSVFDASRFGPATQIVPAWVDEVLTNQGAAL